MTVLAVPVALLVGLVMGGLGGGGAILTVPALVHLLGQSPHEATTSSLVIVGTTALVAAVPHARRGNVRLGQGLAFGLVGTAGSIAGSALSARLSDRALLLLFSALMLLVAVLMVRTALSSSGERPTRQPVEPMLTLRPVTCDCPRVARVAATATVVGLLTGLLGVGGGFVLVPALVLALSLPMPVAVGTSLVVITVNAVTALASRAALATEPVDWSLVGVFTAIAVAGSLLGARAARRVPARVQTGAFSALLVVVAVATAGSALA